ncbi:MAG: ABC transporter permease subunit [Candidatus Sumerlaeota bacterium]|nr:ABC transporter permease subunit [Candidatus Sumerlaeota bacterium]
MRGIPAVAMKEMRTVLRSGKAFFALEFILVVTACTFVIYWIAEAPGVGIAARANFSRQMFNVLSIAQMIALGLISPIMTATVITSERENKTLDLLYCTRLTRFDLLAGKWVAALFFQIILLVCLLPIAGLSFQLGGIGMEEFLFSAVMTAGVVLTYGMIGLACSVRFRRTTPALFAALLIVLFLAVGVPFIIIIIYESGIFHIARSSRSMENSLLFSLSPLTTWIVYSRQYFSGSQGGISSGVQFFHAPIFFKHCICQMVLFLFSSYLAWKGMKYAEPRKVITAGKIIDDQELLRERRRRFPYYLIDPLRRAEEIKDHQNALYIKELRVGGLVKTRVLLRLTYLAMFLSIFVGFACMTTGSRENWARQVAVWTLSILLPFIPVVAATGISREKEEGTFELLQTTLLTPWQIVWGKLRLALRFLGVICLSLLILPVGINIVVSLMENSYSRGGLMSRGRILEDLWSLLLHAPTIACFVLVYASLSLFFSSVFKRNIVSIIVSYLGILFLLVLPFVVVGILEITHMHEATPDFRYTAAITGFAGPLISPYFYFFPPDYGPWGVHSIFPIHERSAPGAWLIIVIIHTAVLLFISFCVLKAAAWRVRKSVFR